VFSEYTAYQQNSLLSDRFLMFFLKIRRTFSASLKKFKKIFAVLRFPLGVYISVIQQLSLFAAIDGRVLAPLSIVFTEYFACFLC